MNKFYETIREYYDYIFPLNSKQVSFVESEFPDKETKLIEIGCANGKLTNALNKYDIMGIDLEQSFIEIAKKRYSDIDFMAMNMLSLHELNIMFDGIICFGNTLVHLNRSEIKEFINQCNKCLNTNGRLLIQILNYENIIDNNVTSLPLIDNDYVEFRRNYKFSDNGTLEFITKLNVKEVNETIENSIILSPIRRNELLEILSQSGFTNISIYGSFAKSELRCDSLPLIISCIKSNKNV